MDKLWTPDDARVAPTERKPDGGTWFDDELTPEKEFRAELMKQAAEMINHIHERPDHVVFVGTIEDRAQLRQVFNFWKARGILERNPDIKIDYGVPVGTVRIDEDRS